MTRRTLALVLWFVAACSNLPLARAQMSSETKAENAPEAAFRVAPRSWLVTDESRPATSLPQATPAPTPAKEQSASPVGSTPSQTVAGAATPVCLCVKGKFRYFLNESFRPGIYPVAAFYTGLTMASPPGAYPPQWRQGFPAFARNFGDFMASWSSVQGGKFVVAALTHEDPRYFPAPSKSFLARAFNAVRFVIVDRDDDGHPRLAAANFAGAFAGGFVGNAYLPSPYANVSHGLSRSLLALTGYATSNLADEFHPEIHKIAAKLHLPFIGK